MTRDASDETTGCRRRARERSPPRVTIGPLGGFKHDPVFSNEGKNVWPSQCSEGAESALLSSCCEDSASSLPYPAATNFWRGSSHHPHRHDGRALRVRADVSVDRAARGKGVGQALMAQVSDWAHTHHASKLAWEVWHRNFGAKTFYEKLGASIDEEAVPYTLALQSD